MSLFDQTNTNNNGNGNQNTGGSSQKPEAQVWMNIGRTVKVENPDSGEMEDVFLSLPLGIPLDTMEDLVAKGSNESWAQTVQGKNAIKAFCQSLAADLTPGQAIIADMLQVEIRRKKDKLEAPAAGTNPLLEQLAQFGIK